jgi:hypothetical protein
LEHADTFWSWRRRPAAVVRVCVLPANAFVFAVRAQAIRNAQLSGCFGYDYDLHETTGKFVQSKKVCNEQSGSINTETSELVPAVPKEPRQLPCLSSLLARLYLLQAAGSDPC